MQKLLFDITKNAALFFAVGTALAIAAPAIAYGIGLAPSLAAASSMLGLSANPLWSGAFFGSFGAMVSTITPVCDKIFSKGEARIDAKIEAKEAAEHAQAVGHEHTHTNHRDDLLQRRTQEKTTSRCIS